jgi:hypothetical protein
MKWNSARRAPGLPLVALSCLGVALAQGPPASTKGIFVDNSGPAVKAELLVYDAGGPRVVGSEHPFRSGDRFRLRFELNRPGYVYLLNRTLPGDPEALGGKGITTVAAEDSNAGRSGDEAYRLIYPTGAAAVRVAAGRPLDLPVDNRFLAMDDQPGVEKLLLVVSREPMDFASSFDLSTGEPKSLGRSGDGPASRDTPEGVLARLRARPAPAGGRLPAPPSPRPGVTVGGTLVDAWRNTRVERHVVIPTKGTEEAEDAVFAVQIDESRPMLVELTLMHYAR